MDNFTFFFNQGLSHISDYNAYDHILFIVALAALYNIRQWKGLLLLVTTFTIGHSIALALATYEVVKIDSGLVEFLIPISIIATCIWNLIQIKNAPYEVGEKQFHVEQFDKTKYTIIIFFGLIHGLGFSNYLRHMIAQSEKIFTPLLSFNIGLEIGQIFILSIVLIINFVLLEFIKIKPKYWATIVTLGVLLFSIPIAFTTGQQLFLG